MEADIVVVDYGSDTWRAGRTLSFPNDPQPPIVLPSAVEKISGGAMDQQNGTSSSVASESGTAKAYTFPIRNGVIEDFDGFEALLHHTLYQELQWQYGNEGLLVGSKPLMMSRNEEEKLTQLAFEAFNVNGMFLEHQAVMSLHAVNKANGCVVDIGHDTLDVAMVVEGQLVTTSCMQQQHAGAALTGMLQELMRQQGVDLTRQQARWLKHACAVAPETPAAFLSKQDNAVAARHKLPDGKEVEIAGEGSCVGEALFTPSVLGLPGPGLVQAVYNCIYGHHDSFGRRMMLENVFVAGGGASIANVSSRFMRELRLKSAVSAQPSLCSCPEYLPENSAHFSSWMGGAILSRVLLQQNQFITKRDYEECGPLVVHRRL